MSVLSELQEAVAAVAVAVGPSVVGIGSRLRGSGVVIADGRVLTNAHNLRGGEVTVRFADGRTTRGAVKGVDWDGDLAVVEADTTGVPAIPWSSVTATIGSAVFAAAATPAGGTRVSFGFVSSVERAFRGPGGRLISGSLEHTAPLAPGSSGSPLLDAEGAEQGDGAAQRPYRREQRGRRRRPVQYLPRLTHFRTLTRLPFGNNQSTPRPWSTRAHRYFKLARPDASRRRRRGTVCRQCRDRAGSSWSRGDLDVRRPQSGTPG